MTLTANARQLWALCDYNPKMLPFLQTPDDVYYTVKGLAKVTLQDRCYQTEKKMLKLKKFIYSNDCTEELGTVPIQVVVFLAYHHSPSLFNNEVRKWNII